MVAPTKRYSLLDVWRNFLKVWSNLIDRLKTLIKLPHRLDEGKINTEKETSVLTDCSKFSVVRPEI